MLGQPFPKVNCYSNAQSHVLGVPLIAWFTTGRIDEYSVSLATCLFTWIWVPSLVRNVKCFEIFTQKFKRQRSQHCSGQFSHLTSDSSRDETRQDNYGKTHHISAKALTNRESRTRLRWCLSCHVDQRKLGRNVYLSSLGRSGYSQSLVAPDTRR